jgi:hypothetical protein
MCFISENTEQILIKSDIAGLHYKLSEELKYVSYLSNTAYTLHRSQTKLYQLSQKQLIV